MGQSRNALWVRPFRRLSLLRSEVEKFLTFQAATDPSANQIVAPSVNTTPLSVTRLPSSVDGRMQWASCVTELTVTGLTVTVLTPQVL